MCILLYCLVASHLRSFFGDCDGFFLCRAEHHLVSKSRHVCFGKILEKLQNIHTKTNVFHSQYSYI